MASKRRIWERNGRDLRPGEPIRARSTRGRPFSWIAMLVNGRLDMRARQVRRADGTRAGGLLGKLAR